ncbi:hypothetical protein A5699_28240 [Mycobacterium sp. E802]|nr:hypothetical protein A5699_28240 [Mycobacterium sp. E802]
MAPAAVGEDHASTVLLRNANPDSRLTPNIVVTEYFSDSAVDLSDVALEYAERKRGSTIGLEVTRSEWIAEDAPAEYGQEMRFTLVSGVVARLVRMTIATPTFTGGTHILEIVFTVAEEQYASCRSEFGEFLKSIQILTS